MSDRPQNFGDLIRSAYRVLLDRDIEDESVANSYLSLGLGKAGAVATILKSEEFLRGHIAAQLIEAGWTIPDTEQPHAEKKKIEEQVFDQLCSSFAKYTGPGTPGFFTDFLGVKTRIKYLPGVEKWDGAVFDYPSHRQHALSGPAEWMGTLRSVLEAKNHFVVMELGAGWGPWLVTSYAAAQQRGITDVQLVGIEGSQGHFDYLLTHLSDNGIDPNQHTMLHGIIGTQDGIAYFPKLADPQRDWGAQAYTLGDLDQSLDENKTKFTDYRGLTFNSLEEVRSFSLATLLAQYDRVDLIHCDIQDSEGEVIPKAFDELNKRVRRIVIGTHSRKSEGALLSVFGPSGWVLEADQPCHYEVKENRVALTNDGVQVWANPRLAEP